MAPYSTVCWIPTWRRNPLIENRFGWVDTENLLSSNELE